MNGTELYAMMFRPIWEDAQLKLRGKQTLLRKLNSKQIYKEGKPQLAKSVLLVLEHAIARGQGTSGGGGRNGKWDGKLSVEHILPQVHLLSLRPGRLHSGCHKRSCFAAEKHSSYLIGYTNISSFHKTTRSDA